MTGPDPGRVNRPAPARGGPRHVRRPTLVAGLALVCLFVAGGASPSPALPSLDPALVGARTVGDRFYPTLGNGGYDVRHYDLDLTWESPSAEHPDGRMVGTARLDMVTTQDLAELSLDLARATTDVTSVRVDGVSVDATRDGLGRKLVVPLGDARPSGTALDIEVEWTAAPVGIHRLGEGLSLLGTGVDRARESRGFLPDGDGGAFLASQPNGAHTLFPANDHPSDTATFTVRITAPPGMLGVATGERVLEVADADGSTTSTWQSGAPVATHVLALGVGGSALVEGMLADGTRTRSVVPAALAPIAGYRLDDLGPAVAWLEGELGLPFPFGTIGVQLVPPGATDAVLEGQTLVLADAGMLDPRISACRWRALLVHEVAHQWFGDSVALTDWGEKWLSEGHATWYEHRWAADAGCDPLGLDGRMTAIERQAQAVRDAGGPPARPRTPADAYDGTIYDQGALALEALRREVGDETFRDIEATWLERYAGGSASTDQYVALASEVAGRDLGPFLEAWLWGDEVPALPADPDATPLPDDPDADASAAAILRPEGTSRPDGSEG
ncbi:MAG: M1 family metallopeptidase [Chloroflexota bacterium]